MIEPTGDKTPGSRSDAESHPARDLSLHLLRMAETRMEAAGIALQSEAQRLTQRLQLKVLGAAALFIAIWGGIVLLAIVLPPELRVPVLAAVVAAFVLGGIVCLVLANRKIAGREVGSLAWFIECLRLDLEIVSRLLGNHGKQSPEAAAREPEHPDPAAPESEMRRPPSDIAA